MDSIKQTMRQKKRIALVAHDNKKQDLLAWARLNRDLLSYHKLYATGTTGDLLEEALGIDIILSNFKAVRSAAISRLGPKSRKATLIS